MIAKFKPCHLHGTVNAPPSKSMAHRFLISAAISGQKCTLSGVDLNNDILASIDCLASLGARVAVEGDRVSVDPSGFMQVDAPILKCRESGSTLRFFIPLALCLGKPVTFTGSERLMERPLSVYEKLCSVQGFHFERDNGCLRVCGEIKNGEYTLQGDVSSQFITGMIFALVYINKSASIEILPPFESRSYVDLTLAALRSFGADVSFAGEYKIEIKPSKMHGFNGRIEGDFSNAAFLEAFNRLGSSIKIENLDPDSLQGDKVFYPYFDEICKGTPTLDISDCPDLGPILIALAAIKNGATFTGTDRLKIKESDRGAAMDAELKRLGGGLIFSNNSITVPSCKLSYLGEALDGHNDHRIVMALSVILSVIGGEIRGAEAVAKSYPGFFNDMIKLGAKVELL